jgi:hypothetical protein
MAISSGGSNGGVSAAIGEKQWRINESVALSKERKSAVKYQWAKGENIEESNRRSIEEEEEISVISAKKKMLKSEMSKWKCNQSSLSYERKWNGWLKWRRRRKWLENEISNENRLYEENIWRNQWRLKMKKMKMKGRK